VNRTRDPDKISYLAEIRVPKGTEGAYVEVIGGPKEFEFLLARGANLEVVDVKKTSTFVQKVVLQVVP